MEYNYLLAALRKFGFGQKFCSWVGLLYSNPQASVRTNNLISDYFPILRGMRQGCPLSPLLFNIAEPLAVSLRENAGLLGIDCCGLNHKLSLYCDDLLLYLSRPDTAIPVALVLITKFGVISGYKIHFSKNPNFSHKYNCKAEVL